MSASETLCFTRYLGVIIRDKVLTNSEFWSIYILIRKILDLVISRCVEYEDSLLLQSLIDEYHELYLRLFKTHLRPKHRHMTHYSHILRNSGPLVSLWSMRFEAKHKEFKDIAHSISSRKNIPYTLSLKSQLKLANTLLKKELSICKEIEFGKCIILTTELKLQYTSLTFYKSIYYHNNFNLDSVSFISWVNYKGTVYNTNNVVIVIDICKDDLFTRFGIIKSIFIDGSKTFFVCCLIKTINFDNHFQAYHRIHSNILEEFENYIKTAINERLGTKRKLNDSNPNTPKQQKLHLYLNDHQKKRVQTKNNFLFFSNDLIDIDGTLKIFSRRKLSCHILENYTFICEKLNRYLVKKHKSFMGVTAHWIDETTITRFNCVLACRRFHGSLHNKIAELLHEIICAFAIEREQLISTVTDNGSNFVKAFKNFGCEIDCNFQTDDLEFNDDRENTDEEESTDQATFENIEVDDITTQGTTIFLPHNLRCASHTLSLITTTDFKNILKGTPASRINHSVMGKCTTLWNLSRRPKSSEIIHNILNCSLKYPCPTRWNSLYNSITQLLKQGQELAALLKPIVGALDFL
ncbi:hypothetical protein QTP88_002565 [Uroleucon formosanum]